MSLLDDVSIVVTPNGYKAGELYAVIPVPTEGAEEITNGDFASDLTGWTGYGTTSATGGIATIGASANSGIFQSILIEGVRYIATVNVTSYDGVGTAQFVNGNGINIYTITETGIQTFIFTHSAASADLVIRGMSNALFSLSSVSVKEYTSADMDVTRATAATRVDENGLVNYALGVEEVTNGDFSNGSTDWTPYGSTLVVSNANPYNGNDTALFTASGVNGAKVTQSISTVVGNTYHLSCYAQYNSGDQTQIEIEGVLEYPNGIGVTSGVTTFTFLQTSFTATSTTSVVAIRERGGNNNASCYLYGLSVKEVNNVPRIDYTGGGCPHILAEPQRTNELTQSNQFDTTWVQSGTLTSGQDGVGGSTDAWKFENPNATSSLYQTDTTSGVQTVSAYFKKNSNYGVRFFAFGSVNCSTYFDLNNGAVVTSINSTAKVESAGADWFRCSMTFDQTNTRCDFYVTNNASTQVVGNITLQYAQLEIGSYPTSYIPTSGSTVTRNQDIFTRDGIGSLINSTEGVLFVEMAALSDDNTFRIISLCLNSSNRASINYSTTSNTIKAQYINSGSATANLSFLATDITLTSKVAFKYKLNDFALWVDGIEVASSTSGSVLPLGTFSKLDFSVGDSSLPFYGKVKQLQVYDTALTDTQLTSLTS